jgi:ATP-dependent RNA helicase RhlE
MKFSEFGLDARLMRAITEAGYETPTPIQAAAIPVALTGQDLVGTAQTGTGKTAAFVLPILQRLLKEHATAPHHARFHRALIVTPTRELAEQINDTIKALARHTRIRSATIYGGVGAGPQERALRDGVEILVACPGRLLDHIDAGLCKLDKIEVLVLDEADRMFDMGFLPQVRRVLSHVARQRQTLLFSATFPREVEELARQSLHKPQRIAVGISAPATTVTHALYPVPQHLKLDLLTALLKKTDAFSMLVFTRTKHRAEKVARVLAKQGFETTSLHSDRSQNQRQRALQGFKDGKYQIMVATDIAARGLDIESVSHVINFDIPDTVDAYIHRIGRTGRAEREGDAFTLITPEDNGMVRDIERALKKPIERRKLDGFDYAMPAPDKPANQQAQSQRPPRRERAPQPQAHGHPQPQSQNGRAPQGRPSSPNGRPQGQANYARRPNNGQRQRGQQRRPHATPSR